MRSTAKSIMTGTILSLAVAAAMGGGAQAASNGVKAGFLKCDVAGSVSFVFGSSRDITCVYDAGTSIPLDHYTGTIKKYGIDIGYQSNGVMIWGVVAPSNNVGPGALAGDY